MDSKEKNSRIKKTSIISSKSKKKIMRGKNSKAKFSIKKLNNNINTSRETKNIKNIDENDDNNNKNKNTVGESNSKNIKNKNKNIKNKIKKHKNVIRKNEVSKKYGKRKIRIEYIDDKRKRQTTFSKRKAGIFKKMDEIVKLTGTEGLTILFSESGSFYFFATPKLKDFLESKDCIDNMRESLLPQELRTKCINSGMDVESNNYSDIINQQFEEKIRPVGIKRKEKISKSCLSNNSESDDSESESESESDDNDLFGDMEPEEFENSPSP
jgi:hypothetical protein